MEAKLYLSDGSIISLHEGDRLTLYVASDDESNRIKESYTAHVEEQNGSLIPSILDLVLYQGMFLINGASHTVYSTSAIVRVTEE